MKKLGLVLAAAAMVAFAGSAAMAAKKAGKGNGAPSGSHYNLNIIGVSQEKSGDFSGSKRHTIFVPLEGKVKILLCESGSDANSTHNDLDCSDVAEGSFEVLDGNATDDGIAAFALPNPDPDGDGVTVYSVFATGLGSGGKTTITTCAEDPEDETNIICNTGTVELTGGNGAKFTNVSKELLYIESAEFCTSHGNDLCALFDEQLEDYFWEYDNEGLRLAQLRFYQCVTDVIDGSEDSCF